jgi:hypothetical protein
MAMTLIAQQAQARPRIRRKPPAVRRSSRLQKVADLRLRRTCDTHRPAPRTHRTSPKYRSASRHLDTELAWTA